MLGAAVFGDQPSPVLRERINHAIRLYEAGTVETIIFTGGASVEGALTESAVSRQYALDQGIPSSAILIEEQSTNTRENLHCAIAIAGEHDTFLIVSTPFHMKRAMKLAAEQGINAYSSPTRSTKWISWYTKGRAYTREVVAYAAYQLNLSRERKHEQSNSPCG